MRLLVLAMALGMALSCSRKPESTPSKPTAATPKVHLKTLERRSDGRMYTRLGGKPFTGRAVSSHPNKKPAIEKYFENGRAHGSHREWRADGTRAIEAHFKNGQWHGRYVNYHPDGQPRLEIHYENGLKHGRHREWRANGLLLYSRAWINGALSKTEYSPTLQAEMDALNAQRRKRDETVWASEVQALKRFAVFRQLADHVTAAADPWQALAKMPVQFQFGKALASVSHESAMEETLFGGTRGESATATWVALKAEGWQITGAEWRLLTASQIEFTLHVHRSDNERATASGALRLAEDALVITRLHVFRRKGGPVFESLAKIDAGKGALPLLVRDLDGDGTPEIIAAGANRVYRRRDGKFVSSRFAKYLPTGCTAAVLADFNGDGHADLFAVPHERPPLWIPGNAKGEFDASPFLVAVRASPMGRAWACSAADIDGDGDLDIWVTQNRPAGQGGRMPTPYWDANDGHPAYLLMNDGKGNFREVTQPSLAAKRGRRVTASALVDLDGDFDNDLVMASEYAGLDIFYNNGKGVFSDATPSLAARRHAFGQGLALADFNGDGMTDVFLAGRSSTAARRLQSMGLGHADFPQHNRQRAGMSAGNKLLLNDGRFLNPTTPPALARTGWSSGCVAMDFDNDGDADLFVANGHRTKKGKPDFDSTFWRHTIYSGSSGKNPALMMLHEQNEAARQSWCGNEHNAFFLNEGKGAFVEAGFLMGLGHAFDGRSAVSADVDGDGRLDLIVAEQTPKGITLHVLRNTAKATGHWVGVRLRGRCMGAHVTVRYEGGAVTRQIISGDSFRAQQPATLHFGLGKVSKIKSIEARWPGGAVTRLENPAADQLHELRPE
jgi:antitoxin component YwqK of YwqJK toxin-antitoxin module